MALPNEEYKPFTHCGEDHNVFREVNGDYLLQTSRGSIITKEEGGVVAGVLRHLFHEDYLDFSCERISFEPDKISPVLDITDDMSLEDKIALALKPDHKLRQWSVAWTEFLEGDTSRRRTRKNAMRQKKAMKSEYRYNLYAHQSSLNFTLDDYQQATVRQFGVTSLCVVTIGNKMLFFGDAALLAVITQPGTFYATGKIYSMATMQYSDIIRQYVGYERERVVLYESRLHEKAAELLSNSKRPINSKPKSWKPGRKIDVFKMNGHECFIEEYLSDNN